MAHKTVHDRSKRPLIRPFRPSDLGPLQQLIWHTIEVSYSKVYPPRALAFFKEFHTGEKILERGRLGTVLVAEESGELIATGSLIDGEIFAVFVHPGFQRGGLGKALMAMLEETARASGAMESVLSVSLPSKRFYEGLGYKMFEGCSRDLGAEQRLDFWKAKKRLFPLEPRALEREQGCLPTGTPHFEFLGAGIQGRSAANVPRGDLREDEPVTYRVLVAVDGTKASNTALEIACALADNYEAHLGLLCVIEPHEVTPDVIEGAIVEGVLERPNYSAWYHSSMDSRGGFAVSEHAQRGAYMARVSTAIADNIVAEAEAFAKDSSAKAVKTFVRSGNVADEILDVARSNDADVVVMGHDQAGWLTSLIKGSVAEKVVREAPCPCLVYCLPKEG